MALSYGQALPPGDGKELIEQNCLTCHGLEVITSQHATKKGWSSIVDNMIQRGATVTPDETRTIVDYLAKNFPMPGRMVNVNKASAKDIERGLELTPKEAEAIVKYREEHGEFRDWNDLAKVADLDQKKLEKRKDRVSFE